MIRRLDFSVYGCRGVGEVGEEKKERKLSWEETFIIFFSSARTQGLCLEFYEFVMLKKTGATYFHITIADMNAKINSSTEQRSIIADVWVDELLWNPVSIICGERVRERNGKAEKNCYYREIVSRDQYLILDRGYLEKWCSSTHIIYRFMGFDTHSDCPT